MKVIGLNPDEWNVVGVITTAFGALATFAAVWVALWLARSPKRPRLVGWLELQIGPKEISENGIEMPFKAQPPNWLEDHDVLKSFRCTIRNLSDNPAQPAVFYYSEKPLGKKKVLQFISGNAVIGPQGDSQQYSMPYMKMDASRIRKVWIADTMDRRWRLDIYHVKRLQKELRKWKHSKRHS